MRIPKDRLLPVKAVETAPVGKYTLLFRVVRQLGKIVLVLALIGLSLIGI